MWSCVGNFPLEVVLEIVSKLDLESITRLKVLSKSFCKMIEESSVIQRVIAREEPGVLTVTHAGSITLYYARDENNVKAIYRVPFHSKHFPKSMVECYFNGLVCFCKCDNVEEQLVICNPLIGEHITLPGIRRAPALSTTYALGYGRLTKEYKVVRVYKLCGLENQPKVYTLGKSSSWRDISSFPPCTIDSEAVIANGAIHWKIEKLYEDKCDGCVLSFDVDKEEFYFTNVHPEELRSHLIMNVVDMIQFGESLAFAVLSFYTDIGIWVHHDNVDKQWVKEYIVKLEIPNHPRGRSWINPFDANNFTVIGLWQQGEILISCDDGSRFCSYDRKTICTKDVTVMPRTSRSTTLRGLICYSRSLISLKPYGFGDTKL